LRNIIRIVLLFSLFDVNAAPAGVVSSFQFVFETTNLPSLNNAGQVAFQHSSSILRWEPGSGSVTTIASSGNTVGIRTIDGFFGTRTSINDAGIVAFRASYTGSSGGIVVGGGSSLTEVAFDSFASDLGARPRVNNLNQVVYTANDGEDIRREVIGNSTITTIATDSEFGFTPSPTPAMNNNGDVVFQGNRISPFEQGIYTGTPSNRVAIGTNADTLRAFSVAPDINDSLEAVYVATFDVPSPNDFDGLYFDSPTISPIRIAGGPDFIDGTFYNSNPNITNNGEVYVSATHSVDGTGIYRWDGTTLQRLIGEGDSLDGGIIQSVFLGHDSVNDAGQFAFRATIDTGTSTRNALFVGTVSAVPEPRSLLALGAGFLCVALRFRRRNSQCSGADSSDRSDECTNVT